MKKILLSSFLILLFIFIFIDFNSKKNTINKQYRSVSAIPTRELTLTSSLDLEGIFFKKNKKKDLYSSAKLRTLVTTGDVLPARMVNYLTVTKDDFFWPYRKVRSLLKEADISFINLETPIIDNCPLTQTGMIFCGDPRNVQGLIYAGIDVANLANNHILNYGEDGVKETINYLHNADIKVVGSKDIAYKDVRGLRFAFLGYTDVGEGGDMINIADRQLMSFQIKQAKKNADIVVVSFHWGIEYQNLPSKRQIELAHLAIEEGADLIIGHHPHWIQPPEIYKNKVIIYSHGNFIFDQMWSQKTREGIVVKFTFYQTQLVDVEIIPILIHDYGQPNFLTGSEKERVLKEMYKDAVTLQNLH